MCSNYGIMFAFGIYDSDDVRSLGLRLVNQWLTAVCVGALNSHDSVIKTLGR